jgi:hypothetical protein
MRSGHSSGRRDNRPADLRGELLGENSLLLENARLKELVVHLTTIILKSIAQK